MDAATCGLFAQVIPVLLLALAVGDGLYLRESKRLGDKNASTIGIVFGIGAEFAALTGAVSGGIDSPVISGLILAATYVLLANVAVDLLLRLWRRRD